MITVTFTLDPTLLGTVTVTVTDGPLPYGDGTMTLQQFRNAMPQPIRVAVRAAITQALTQLEQAATTAAARAATNADQADADRLTAQAAALDQWIPSP